MSALHGCLLVSVTCFVLVAYPTLFAVGAGVAGAVSFFARGRVRIPTGMLLPIALVGSLTLVLFPDEMAMGSQFVGPASVKVAFYCNLLACIALIRAHTSSEEPFVAAMAVVALGSCGLVQLTWTYGGAVLVFLVFFVRFTLYRIGSRFRAGTFLCMFVALFMSVVMALGLKWSDRYVNALLSLVSPGLAVGARFPVSSGLNTMLVWQGSQALVLRVFTADPEGYLVGRTYTEFDGRAWQWKATKKEIKGSSSVVPVPGLPQGLFVFGEPPKGEAVEGRLSYPHPIPGTTLFLPRDAAVVGMKQPGRLHLYSDGILQVLAKDDFDGDVFYLRQAGLPLEASPEQLKPFRQLPDELAPAVWQLAAKLKKPGQSDRQLAGAVENYFHQNFQYGFGYPFSKAEDPIQSFLTEKPPAHCELFASSMTLVLRSLEIPARYVTGFLVTEKGWSEDYYVVRAKHAHAWVEVYLEGEGWVRFDPTPPGSLNRSPTWLDRYRGLSEYLSYRFSGVFAWFSLDWRDKLKVLFELSQSLVKSPWLGLFVVLGALYFWRRRLGPRKKAASSGGLSYRKDELDHLLREFDASLSERRPAHLTLLEWSAPFEEDDWRKAFAKTYCRARFGGEELLSELKALLRRSS